MKFNLRGLLQDEEFLLGAGLLTAGSQGQHVGQAVFPSMIQAAKVKKAFAPEFIKPMEVFDKKINEKIFVNPKKIGTEGGRYVPVSTDKETAGLKNYEHYLNILKKGTPLEKKAAGVIFGKGGREPLSKTEFLQKMVIATTKDIGIDIDDIKDKLIPKWEQIYDQMIGDFDNKMNSQNTIQDKQLTDLEKDFPGWSNTEIIQGYRDDKTTPILQNFKGTQDQWNQLKESNPNVPDKTLIEWFNKNYGV